jgi:hypothetical protein
MSNPDNIRIKSKKAKLQEKRPLKFVNISHPVGPNRETKNIIQTHMIQDRYRRKRDRETPIEKSCDGRSTSANDPCKSISLTNSEDSEVCIPRQPFGLLDPFTTFPVNMEPYMYTLIHTCKPSPTISHFTTSPLPPHLPRTLHPQTNNH